MKPEHRSEKFVKNFPAGLNRRELLQRAAWVLAAAGIPLGSELFAQEISPAMNALSKYMSEARDRALPDNVVEEAKHHILDTFAAMVSGSELPPGVQALKFAKMFNMDKGYTVVASKYLCGPIEAAIVNGEMAHSDETDDDYTGGGAHPGASIVPTVLAMGEKEGISGTHFLRAVTLGYDVGMRAFKTLSEGVLKDTHNLVGSMGSCAAAGCALSLNQQQMRWLIDYATQQAGAGIPVWRRDTEHIEKGFVFGGMGARNAVTAALMIQMGWTGVNDVLAGPDNFVTVYAPKADPSVMVDKLGERFEVTYTTLKRWTTGGPIQSPLDALQLILKKHPIDINQIKEVVVRESTSAAYTVNNREMPDICLQHMVAVMLIDKTASFKAAHDKPRMQDPEVLRVRAKVKLVPDEEFEKMIPKRVAVVEITMNDGTKVSERVESVRGTPENPMSREEVVAKARDLMVPVLGDDKTTKFLDRMLNIEKVKDVRELRPLLQRG